MLQGETQQALFDSPEAETVRLQISYGCPAFCTFCLGIEGISDRLRSYFNKNLDKQTALHAITRLLKEPVRMFCSFGLLVRMSFTPLRYEKLLIADMSMTKRYIRKPVRFLNHRF